MSGKRSMPPFTARERRGDDERHGTPSGAYRHSKAGEDPCDACRAAKAEYDQRRLQSTDLQIRNRLHAKAQARAHTAMSKAHPAEYRRLYLAFKEQLLGEVESA